MVYVQPVQSIDHPQLAPYRTMRRQYEQRQQGIFVAEGEKVVRRLLESELEVISLLLPEKWLQDYQDLLSRRTAEKIIAFTAEKSLLEKLTGFSMYQGVLAVARVPQPVSFEEILAGSGRPLLLLAVEGLSSAENLGGLIRNCAAFGAHALVAGETCCSPYLRRAVRSSMGTLFKLPVIESANLVQTLRSARESGLRLIAAHPHTEKSVLSQADFTGDCVIVVGSEGSGISAEVLEICHQAVAIPMQNEVDSLNVGTAGAIFLYEASRQRQQT